MRDLFILNHEDMDDKVNKNSNNNLIMLSMLSLLQSVITILSEVGYHADLICML